MATNPMTTLADSVLAKYGNRLNKKSKKPIKIILPYRSYKGIVVDEPDLKKFEKALKDKGYTAVAQFPNLAEYWTGGVLVAPVFVILLAGSTLLIMLDMISTFDMHPAIFILMVATVGAIASVFIELAVFVFRAVNMPIILTINNKPSD